MRGYLVTALPRAVRAAAAALLLILALIGSASAQRNLALNSKPFSSTDWQQDQGNTSFVAAKAFDGNLGTRWNSASGDDNGSFLGTRWDAPQSVTKIIIREAIDRIRAFRVQQFDATKNDWADVLNVSGDLFTTLKGDTSPGLFTIRFKPPVQTTGIRLVFDEVTVVPTIYEVEVYDIPSGILQGTVRDDKGTPITGAIVQAGPDRVFTDANGKYALTTDAGTYNVTAGKPGAFRTKIARSVTIGADTPASLDFALVALPPNLALQGKAASSSDDDSGNFAAAKANDGNLATRWLAGSGDQAGAFLELDWTSPQTFTKVAVREQLDRIRNYTLQRWDDSKSDWADIATNVAVPARGGNPVLSNVFAQPFTSSKVRLLVVDATAEPSVIEMEVSNAATATISGVVKDAVTGQGVPRATVVSDLGDTTVADDKGAFTLVVEPDDYVFSAQATGYFNGAGVPVTIKAGETQAITLALPPPGPNLAKEGKPIASSENPDQPATSIIDGDLDTFWQVASDKHANEWIGVTWEKPTTFTVVQLRGVQTYVQNSDLQVLAEDGKTWVELPNTRYSANATGFNQDFLFPQGVTTTGLRWFIAEVYAVDDNPGLSEMIVYNSPIPK
jgi:hypothetical protein